MKRVFASGENKTDKHGISYWTTIIAICGIGCAVIAISYNFYVKEIKGIVVNGVPIKYSQMAEYQTIVENDMSPEIFSDYNGALTKGFKYHLVEDIGDIHAAFFGRGDNLMFIDTISVPNEFNLAYEYSYDKDVLSKNLEELNKDRTASEDAYIDTNTYEIVDEIYGNQYDVNAVINALDGKNAVDLDSCYITPDVVSSDLTDNLQTYKNYKDWTISYKSVDGKPSVNITVPNDKINIDAQGNLSLCDDSFLDSYIEAIDDNFNTQGRQHLFKTHAGDIITVNGGTFGDLVDNNAELAQLKQLFAKCESDTDRFPVYETDMNENIQTYVEVSIDEQHAWYYKDGEVALESDCVTGCVAKHNNTPKGYWYVDYIQNGRTLYPKGATKGSWVNKWMRFTPDGCGLHDASWRSSFGGQIYKNNGSHGCVNLPKDFAYALFEEAYIGLPVIVY